MSFQHNATKAVCTTYLDKRWASDLSLVWDRFRNPPGIIVVLTSSSLCRSFCWCHNSDITCDGIGPTKMTSGWIYKLRKLRGFMILASQLLVPPGIPLPSKPLPSVAFHFPMSTEEFGKCLSRFCTATISGGHLYCSALSSTQLHPSERSIFVHLQRGSFIQTWTTWETKTL